MGVENSGIVVRCACGKALRARMELAGRNAKCPACGTMLTVPIPPQQTPRAQTPFQSFAPPFAQRRPQAHDMRTDSTKVVFWVLGAVGLVLVAGVLLIVMKVFIAGEPDKETPVASSQQPARETPRNNPSPPSNNPTPDQPAVATSQPAPQTTPELAPAAEGDNIVYDGEWEAKLTKVEPTFEFTFIVKNNNVTVISTTESGSKKFLWAVVGTWPVLGRAIRINAQFPRLHPSHPLYSPLPIDLELSGEFESATTAAGKLTFSNDPEIFAWTAIRKSQNPPGASPPAGGNPAPQDAPEAPQEQTPPDNPPPTGDNAVPQAPPAGENGAQPPADDAAKFTPHELTEDEKGRYGRNGNPDLANSIGWSIYDNETGKLCMTCPEGAAEAIRAAMAELDFSIAADREKMVREFVRIMGPDHARKHPLVFYDGAGVPKYVGP